MIVQTQPSNTENYGTPAGAAAYIMMDDSLMVRDLMLFGPTKNLDYYLYELSTTLNKLTIQLPQQEVPDEFIWTPTPLGSMQID